MDGEESRPVEQSLAYVKEQLGQHSIRITVDTYGHPIPGANRKAVNALADPGWSDDLFQPPDLIEQSPDGYGPRPLSQRKRVLPGMDHVQGVEAEVR